MKSTLLLMSLLTGSLLTITSCSEENVTTIGALPYQSSFQRDADGWVADITDYGVDQANIMEFKSGWKALPAPLDTTRKSLMVESMNRSDDAFMFIKKKLTGLTPNTDYSLIFTVELASQYPANSVGIGGSPGGSVFLKVGASSVEPVKVLKDNFYSINIDKGDQNNDGANAIRIGNIGTEDTAEGYKLIKRTNQDTPLKARTNDKGELWLLVGTDSGFEGLTTLYYSSIKVTTKATM